VDKPRQTAADKPVERTTDYGKPRVSFDRNKSTYSGQNRSQGLSSVEQSKEQEYETDDDDEGYWHREDEDRDDGYDDEEEAYAWRMDTKDDDDTPPTRSALSAVHGAERAGADDFGCLKKIMHGTCTSKNCSFNHGQAAMLKTANEIGGKCTNYVKNGLPTGAAQPTAILRRDQPGPRV
jgi:hypothetical protein